MSDFQVRTANIIADTGDPEGEVKCLVIDRDTFTQLIANLEEIKKRYIDLPERKIRWGSKILTFTFLRIFYYFSRFLRNFSNFRIHEEFKALKLSDLRIIATLGVGGFGRVELVCELFGNKSSSFLGVVSYLENFLPGNDCRGFEDPQLCLEADEEESDCGD